MRMSFHRVRKTVAPGETLGDAKTRKTKKISDDRPDALQRSEGHWEPRGQRGCEVLRQQSFREGRSNNNDSGHTGTGN